MLCSRRSFVHSAASAVALASVPAWAQPSLSRVYVGFAAGGTLDVIARRLADRFKGSYGETVIVESKVGAGGRIANEALKSATPNGGAMVLSPSSPIVIFPHVYSKLAYDPQKDLVAVTPVCSNAQVFVISSAVPEQVRTLAQFVDWAKANPGKGAYGTPAAGSIMHFQGLVFQQKAGIQLTHVAYRGMAAVVLDLIGGNLPSSMAVMGDVTQHIATGKLRALAVTSERRSRFLPEVPTFAEQGFGEVTGVDWYGLFVPATTPQAVIDSLHANTLAAVQHQAFAEPLEKAGFDPYTLPQAEFAKRIRAETLRWGPVVRASGFTAES
ncbi:tripartite tricarboxylate transporter substrate-binding protein [Methylibium sp.]|uniref:tripartite tricarboxylate transporter substrate-binding protein n=1 Tax=Methylibium sp. TaxID=2067992 RepID=UPI003D1009A5